MLFNAERNKTVCGGKQRAACGAIYNLHQPFVSLKQLQADTNQS